ncbi:hypothetical protein BDP27DRAFT_435805 [Rhodocollybia butyracea]|uniref:Uncharacterized protein n=1 Tax=Rhodocollybia butyracea TaxID=206335 RepID=A0A9P5PAW6_9AGAR|nr:hypothetical protein BDP27DRAFT_435805 [Rhodocollybia butyracea]
MRFMHCWLPVLNNKFLKSSGVCAGPPENLQRFALVRQTRLDFLYSTFSSQQQARTSTADFYGVTNLSEQRQPVGVQMTSIISKALDSDLLRPQQMIFFYRKAKSLYFLRL